MNEVKKLLEFAARLPKGLAADWENSNHFELSTPRDPMWFVLRWCRFDGETDDGRLAGMLLDIAVALKAAEPELRKLLKSPPKPETRKR